MVWKLGNPVHVFQVSGSGQTSDLHDQCHWGVQPPAEKGNEIQDGISVRWESVENAVSGNHGHNKEVDRPPTGLGPDQFATWDLFWRTVGKPVALRPAFIDMQKNPCIIQVRAEPRFSALLFVTINVSYISFWVYTKLESLSCLLHQAWQFTDHFSECHGHF